MKGDKAIHIVLADDDEDDREVFEMAVDELKLPVEITPVPDGKRLIDYLDNNKAPDILFLDLNMPRMKGTECLQIIRSNERFKKLPVIILSTSSAKRDIDQSYDLEANYYIVKPFSYMELATVIKKLISKEWKEDFIYPPRNKFLVNGSKT
jgi:CheY-like chemotaxis protein